MTRPRRTRVLMLGPLPREGSAIGGTQVSFSELIRELRARGTLDIEVIDTSRDVSRPSGWRRGLEGFGLFARSLRAARERLEHCDVLMFNASSGAMLRAGPFFAALARLHGVPFVARCFGGNLELAIERASRVEAALAMRMLVQADLVLLQTRSLCEHFSRVARVEWLPTTRTPATAARRRDKPARKFLFVSQLRPQKGFAEAVEAIEQLPAACSLTLIGPAMPDTDVAILENHPRAKWLGALDRAGVARALAEHDVFVFPSYYDGEGLPGAVIEALQAGLPVVAADWRSIRDLVAHEENGLLVPIRDATALANAMQRLASDAGLVRKLSRGATTTGRAFEAAPVLARLESMLDSLSQGPALPASRPMLEVANDS
ncbi:MAG TPA: glycosyltransferase family 4 protein [Planctomycetota bacterium]|nr:glycosyltransferase family 4 protein [Planctomycetota bacterium]